MVSDVFHGENHSLKMHQLYFPDLLIYLFYLFMYIFPYFISLDLILLKINAAQLSENIESRVQLTIDCFIATQLSQSSRYF